MEQLMQNPFIVGIGAGLVTYYLLDTMKPAVLFHEDGTPVYDFLTPMTIGGLVAGAAIYFVNQRNNGGSVLGDAYPEDIPLSA